jgi:hypothetical protein
VATTDHEHDDDDREAHGKRAHAIRTQPAPDRLRATGFAAVLVKQPVAVHASSLTP